MHINFALLCSALQNSASYQFKIEGGMERGVYDCGRRDCELNEAYNKWNSYVLWTLLLSSL
jgi:hypothetical protein